MYDTKWLPGIVWKKFRFEHRLSWFPQKQFSHHTWKAEKTKETEKKEKTWEAEESEQTEKNIRNIHNLRKSVKAEEAKDDLEIIIIPFLTMIYWVLTLVISPEGQEVFSSTLAGQL